MEGFVGRRAFSYKFRGQLLCVPAINQKIIVTEVFLGNGFKHPPFIKIPS